MKKNNIIYILTLVLTFIAIIIFELLYCNSRFISGVLYNTENAMQYNFSLFRMLLYIIILIMLIIFNKKLKGILEETKDSDIRKKVILLYSVASVFAIIYVTYKFIGNKLPLPKIATEYLLIILTGLCLTYLSKDYIKNIIVITSTIALLFVITIDINNTIDEKKHFMSAYCLSTGQFDFNNAKLDKRFFELDNLVKYTNIEDLFENNFKENLTDDYKKEEIESVPAGYNPILYLPSTIGILVAKNLSNNMADIYFAGRLFNLIAYAALIIVALKLLPYKKNTFYVIFLMPMLLALGSVYTVDAVSMGIISIFIAYCFKLKETEHIGLKEILILLLLSVALCIPKSMAYIFVGLIVFILPVIKIFKENKKYIPYIIAIIILALLGVLYSASNKELSEDPRGGNTNIEQQIDYLSSNPLNIIKLGINHIRLTLTNFNWLSGLNNKLYFADISLNVFLFLLLFILYVSITDNSKNLKMKDKILMILAFFITYAFTSLVLYLSFTPVGSNKIEGYQTRYIFPILPLLMICISNPNICLKNTENQKSNITYISTFFIILSAMGSVLMG